MQFWCTVQYPWHINAQLCTGCVNTGPAQHARSMTKHCCHLLTLLFRAWQEQGQAVQVHTARCLIISSYSNLSTHQLGPSMLPLEGHHNHLDILSRGKHRYAPHAHLEHAFVSYFVHSPSGLVFYSQLHLQCHLARWMCTCHAPMQGIMHQSHTSRACSTATRHKHGMQHS